MLTALQQHALESAWKAYESVDALPKHERLVAARDAAEKILADGHDMALQKILKLRVAAVLYDVQSHEHIQTGDVWWLAARRLGISENALHLALDLSEGSVLQMG